MTTGTHLLAPTLFAARILNRLQPFLLLATRWYVGWQFFKAGWLKLTSWDSTLWLFENEYHTPLLTPHAAALAGTTGELVFPVLLFVGLYGRLAALGMSAVNVVAVISYAQVLLAEGGEAALGQHLLWGFMLLALLAFGPGRLSADCWLARRHEDAASLSPACV